MFWIYIYGLQCNSIVINNIVVLNYFKCSFKKFRWFTIFKNFAFNLLSINIIDTYKRISAWFWQSAVRRPTWHLCQCGSASAVTRQYSTDNGSVCLSDYQFVCLLSYSFILFGSKAQPQRDNRQRHNLYFYNSPSYIFTHSVFIVIRVALLKAVFFFL